MRIRRDDDSTDEVGRMHIDAATGANGGPMHTHRLQEERFIVQTGVLLVRRGHERTRVGPGEDVRVRARMPHTWRAETESSLIVELRPALRTREFWRDLFALPTDQAGQSSHRRIRPADACLPGRIPILPPHSTAAPAGAGVRALEARVRSTLVPARVSNRCGLPWLLVGFHPMSFAAAAATIAFTYERS